MFPADLLVLGTAYENGRKKDWCLFIGVCYIETSSLDGEKNLKPKSAIKETLTFFHEKECKYIDEVGIEA